MDIDFEKGFESKEEAQKVVKQIRQVIEDLTNAVEAQKENVSLAMKLVDKYQEDVVQLTQASIDMSSAFKDIHMVMNADAELVDSSPELKELRKSLASFVVGSGMIKLGVMGVNKNDEEKNV